MLKKQITYTDYNGITRTETFHFNLNKAELVKMDLLTEGGMEERINKMIESKDHKEIVELLDSIIMKAYGEKSSDGKRLNKSDEISAAFAQTEAYSELFIELMSDADATAKFIAAIVPQEVPTEAVATVK